jgi:hypothetical protein
LLPLTTHQQPLQLWQLLNTLQQLLRLLPVAVTELAPLLPVA